MKNVIAVDLETDGLHRGCQIKSFAYYGANGGDVFPYTDPTNVDFLKLTLDLQNPNIAKVFHSAQFDVRVLRDHGILIRGPIHCTYVMAALLFPNDPEDKKRERLDLKNLSRKFLKETYIEETRLLAWLKKNRLKKEQMSQAPDYLLHPYNLKDAQCTFGLFYLFSRAIVRLDMKKIYDKEMRVTLGPVMDMEATGMRIDIKRTRELLAQAEKRRAEIKNQLRFNPMAPRQIAKHVFGNGPGLAPVLAWTKGGKKTGPIPKTDELALWRAGTPKAKLIVEYKKLHSASIKYLGKLYRVADLDSRVHCNVRAQGAKTGRLSIANPPLQQLPRVNTVEDTGILQKVRSVFVPDDEDSILACIDFSQIELRICASRSGQDWMIQAFRDGRSIHKEACTLYFGYTEGTPEFDRLYPIAKNLNFAVQYGAKARKLHEMFLKQAHLDIPIYQCAEYLLAYQAKNPAVMDYFTRIAREISTTGGVRNCYGRFIPVELDASYRGVNYDIQGTAAEIMKRAMLRIHKFMREENLQSRMLLQIHDELIFNIKRNERWCIPVLADLMIPRRDFGVPITCEVKAGFRWSTARKLDATKLTALASLRAS